MLSIRTNTRRSTIVLSRRLQSTATGCGSSSSSSSSASSSSSSRPASQKELDPIILDEIFQKNKSPFLLNNKTLQKSSRLYYADKVNTATSSTTKVQENKDSKKDTNLDLSEIDKNLKYFKSNIPINFKYYLRNLSNLNNFKQLPYKFGDNQIMDSSMEKELQSILWDFNAPIRYSFGYGSGVFSQGQDNSKPSQIDLNFIVTYPSHWHSLNLAQYPQHYSFLKYLGSSTISKVQQLGAGVYFNPYVKNLGTNKQNLVKYGVSSMDTLISDLINWDTFYLSGRLQKPTMVLRNSANITLLQNFNLINAIKLSLLLLDKKQVSEYQLYETITSLSYSGDPRMKIGGENPNKVKNIVSNQIANFRKMYLPLIETYFNETIQIDQATSSFYIDLNNNFKQEVIAELPKNFRRKLFNAYSDKFSNELAKDPLSQSVLQRTISVTQKPSESSLKHLQFKDLQQINLLEDALATVPERDYEYLPTNLKKNSEFIAKIASASDLNYQLNKTLQEIIFTPALFQSLKGVLTAGFVKSFDYALEKRLKYNKSLK